MSFTVHVKDLFNDDEQQPSQYPIRKTGRRWKVQRCPKSGTSSKNSRKKTKRNRK